MHERHLVCVARARAQFRHPAELVGDRDRRLAPDQIGHRVAGHVLHHDVRLRRELAEVEDGDDVGMAQRRCSTRFAREALARIRHVEIAGEHLDRDHPAEHGIVRDVHSPHTAATEPPLNLVPADLSTWLQHSKKFVWVEASTIGQQTHADEGKTRVRRSVTLLSARAPTCAEIL